MAKRRSKPKINNSAGDKAVVDSGADYGTGGEKGGYDPLLTGLLFGGGALAGGYVGYRAAGNRVGVHHSVSVFKGKVNVSGKRGVTAMDQVPGQSYMWSTRNRDWWRHDSKDGAWSAATEVPFQTNRIADRLIDFPTNDPRAVGYVTSAPVRNVKPDPNLKGSSVGLSVTGQQKVLDTVVGTGPATSRWGLQSTFIYDDMLQLTRAVRNAKIVEGWKNAAKVAAGAVAGALSVDKWWGK